MPSSDLPPFLGQLDKGNFTGIRTDRKPRANHRYFGVKRGFRGEVVDGGNSLCKRSGLGGQVRVAFVH